MPDKFSPSPKPIAITPNFSVTTQIFPKQFPTFAKMGFTCIISARPDKEEDEDEQPPRWLLEQQATANGLHFSHIPIETGAAFPEIAIRATAHLLESNPEKTLGFCLTGIRSVRLWALGSALAGLIPPEQILSTAKAAGFDLSQFQAHLDRLSRRKAPFYVADDTANLI